MQVLVGPSWIDCPSGFEQKMREPNTHAFVTIKKILTQNLYHKNNTGIIDFFFLWTSGIPLFECSLDTNLIYQANQKNSACMSVSELY